jgi:hypothetical protein
VTAPRDAPAQRAARLLCWYPRAWRARYGEEFAELLIAEFAERPTSWRRTADVARGGVVARLTSAGLTSHQLEPADQMRAGLATAACSLGAFLAFGIAMWAQLTIDWEWTPPATTATRIAMVAMSAAVALIALLALLALAPLVGSAARGVLRRQARHVGRPVLLAMASAGVLVAGSCHFARGWPGTGAHTWAQHGLVPAGVAALSWAATLSVSSYWAHPAALAAFPATEIAWMAASPVALITLVIGLAGMVRRLDLSLRVLCYEARLSRAAAAAMALFLAGAFCWVPAEGSGPGLFHAGAIDIGSLAVMMLALCMAGRATGQARAAAARDR